MDLYKKHYEKAIEILDMLNELLSDISWDESENDTYDEVVSGKLNCLYYAIEDAEATLSDALYDTELQEFYEEVK